MVLWVGRALSRAAEQRSKYKTGRAETETARQFVCLGGEVCGDGMWHENTSWGECVGVGVGVEGMMGYNIYIFRS